MENNNTKEKIFLIFVLTALLVSTITIFDSNNKITGKAYDSYVNLTLLSKSVPYIDSIAPISANVGDIVNFTVNGHDADNNTLYYSDNCAIFNINSTTGKVYFAATYSIVGNYLCNITVTDLSFTNFTSINITIKSVCGDGYCAPNELCSSCSADCGVCPSTSSTTSPGSGGLSQGVPASALCSPKYECTEWSRCMSDSYSYRSCKLTNSCAGTKPLEQKSCVYTPTKLESSLTQSTALAKSNPTQAIKDTKNVISLKEEDIKLLQELRFDDWKTVGSNENTFGQAQDLLDEIYQLLNVAEITTQDGEKVYTIFNANSQVEQIVRDVPEVEKVAKNCFERVDYVADTVNNEAKENVYNANKDLSIYKCYSNYDVTNKETSDNIVKLTKIDVQVSIEQPIYQKLIVEIVPKEIAKSIDEIKFYNTENIIVIQEDPIFAWKLDNLKGGEVITLSYIVKTHANNSETGAIEGIDTERRVTVVGKALERTKSTCEFVLLYKTYAVALLAISLFILMFTNIILPYNRHIKHKKDKENYIKNIFISNKYSYYAVYLFASYSIIINLICFHKDFLIEILGFTLIMITTYYMNKPMLRKIKNN